MSCSKLLGGNTNWRALNAGKVGVRLRYECILDNLNGWGSVKCLSLSKQRGTATATYARHIMGVGERPCVNGREEANNGNFMVRE